MVLARTPTESKTPSGDQPKVAPEAAPGGQDALKSELRGMDFDAQTARLAPPTDTPQAASSSTWTVKSGETLSVIAKKALGDSGRWRELHAWNKDVIGANPNALKVGMVLSLQPSAGGGKTDATDAGGKTDATEAGGKTEATDAGGKTEATDAGSKTDATTKDGKAGATSGGKTDASTKDGKAAGPSYPHVVFMRGAGTSKAHAAWAQSTIASTLTRWGAGAPGRVEFHTLSGSEPAIVVEWLGAWGTLPATADLKGDVRVLEARLARAAIENLAGFKALDAGKQERLRAMVGGETNNLSSVARSQFARMLNTDKLATLAEKDQSEALQKLIGSPDAIPGLVGHEGDTYVADPFTIKGPEDAGEYAFRAAKVPAEKWVVSSAGHTLTVYAPKAPDAAAGHFHTAEQAAEAWAALPPKARAAVHTVALNPAQNPDDAYWSVQYGMPNFRSYMTAGSSGVVDVYPTVSKQDKKALSSKLIHESGHVMTFQDWGHDTKGAKWQPWLAAMASDGTSVSRYAQADPAEDVAETTEIYVHTKGSPRHEEYRAIVPARFTILDGYLK